jgi:hypothetical protein
MISVCEPIRRIAGSPHVFGTRLGVLEYSGQAAGCHSDSGNSDNGHTMSVPFPEQFDAHLAHGDTVGPCQDHEE